MQIYTQKQRWKAILIIAAALIGVATTWYTNVLVQELAEDERAKIELWAKATEYLATPDMQEGQNLAFLLSIIQNNNTIPIITVDDDGRLLSANNMKLYDLENKPVTGQHLDNLSKKSSRFIERQLAMMKDKHDPIIIDVLGDTQYLYYKDSVILNRIQLFPILQLAVIFLFIFVAYFAFSSTRRAEQNQVWVGMSKETAHQLGTPISSLMAWMELMKM